MKFNPNVLDCAPAPIAEAWSWIDDKDDPHLLDVCQAVPAYPPHESLRTYLGNAIARGDGATYTAINGIEPLRVALAQDINQRYATDINADHVAITAGCNQGFCSVIDTLCDRGDQVIVAEPCYFNHRMWLDIRGVDIRWLSFNKQSAVPDPGEVGALVTDRTRAIILVTPNNPTGAIYSAEVIDQFYQVAKQHKVPLILDETYRDFMDDAAPPHGLFQKSDWHRHFIHLYSFSKAFSLTGHRVGALAAGADFFQQWTKIQDCVAISAPHAGQLAALYGLENLVEWRRQKGREMIDRGAAITRAFDHPDLGYQLITAGAYFAYIKHPFPESARDVARHLAREFGVVCLPGIYFGDNQDQYLRFAFANLAQDRFPDLIERLLASQAKRVA